MELNILYYDQGTEEDGAALKYVKSLLGDSEGTLQVLYVKENPSAVGDEKRQNLAEEQRKQKTIAACEPSLEKAESIMADLKNMEVELTRLKGDPVKEVKGLLSKGSYHLLVMTAFGRGGFSKDLIGAHAKPLVQQFGVPVLLHKGKLETCERILINVPPNRERCLSFARFLSLLLGGSRPAITFLSIIENEHRHFEGYTSAEESRLTEALEDSDREELEYPVAAQRILEQEGFDAEVRHRSGDMTQEMLNEAREGRYDLMAFSPEEHGPLQQLWFGDESFEVMRDIEISVLKVPGSFEFSK